MVTGQAEALMPMIGEAMEAAGVRFGDLDRIVVTTGPGTFTGMRIGVAAARALSLALHIPVIGLTSFDVMALNPALARQDGEVTVIVMDARRGQCYVQVLDSSDLAASAGPRIVPVDELASAGGRGPIVFAGSGARMAAEVASRAGRTARIIAPDLQPDISHALAAASQTTSNSKALRPLYLRPPDAKPQDGKSLARIS